jgi:hypothetical protein
MDDIDLIGGRHSRDAFRFPVISTEPSLKLKLTSYSHFLTTSLDSCRRCSHVNSFTDLHGQKKNRTFESPSRFAQHSCVAALPSASEIRTAGNLALTAPSPSSFWPFVRPPTTRKGLLWF